FCPDEPMLLAMGGSNGESRIWDMATTMQIRRVFGGEAVASVVVEEKPMVGIQNDEDKEEDPENTHEAVIAEMRGTGTQPTDGDSGDSDESMDSDSD
ncbi:rRNA-processing protein, partial [Coemansia sp. RSA 2522]